jgi:DNA helicase II / ATP-dependent DNA helicase PcrA
MITAPTLDAFQQKVVASDAPSIRMVAPAGSGKTETLARRIQARIAAGIAPGRILLLTFDNNARVSALNKLQALGVPDAVRVSTLNAFGFHLLNTRFTDERRRIIREVYFPSSPVLGELVTEYGHSVFTEMLAKIKNAAIDPRTTEVGDLAKWCSKNREHLLRDLEDDPILEDVSDVRFGRELAREMLGYEQFLEQKNGIDFDDQKLRPLIRLQQDDRALQQVQQAFDDVIVDEFQDINLLDVKLINLIAGQSTLLITGDDDQAIYGFRGATARYLIHPEKELNRTFASFER